MGNYRSAPLSHIKRTDIISKPDKIIFLHIANKLINFTHSSRGGIRNV